MNRRARPAGLALLPSMASLNAADPAKPVDPVFTDDDPGILKLIGEEPVAEDGIVFVDFHELLIRCASSTSRPQTGSLSHL